MKKSEESACMIPDRQCHQKPVKKIFISVLSPDVNTVREGKEHL